MLNSLIGKLVRHGSSALLGALGSHGLSSGAAEEIVTAVVGLALSVFVSKKLG